MPAKKKTKDDDALPRLASLWSSGIKSELAM
jgi:hypothetical protein